MSTTAAYRKGYEAINWGSKPMMHAIEQARVLESNASEDDQNNAFLLHLSYASETVKAWPEWKRTVLGDRTEQSSTPISNRQSCNSGETGLVGSQQRKIDRLTTHGSCETRSKP